MSYEEYKQNVLFSLVQLLRRWGFCDDSLTVNYSQGHPDYVSFWFCAGWLEGIELNWMLFTCRMWYFEVTYLDRFFGIFVDGPLHISQSKFRLVVDLVPLGLVAGDIVEDESDDQRCLPIRSANLSTLADLHQCFVQ